jgi:hypothetical protein
MEGDNRTPGKTIGEVKYAQERAHAGDKDIVKEGRAPNKAAAAGKDAPSSSAQVKDRAKAGDNRTPEKTIGEVKYAQERSTHTK